MPQNYGDSDHETISTPPSIPRWVKVLGLIAIVVVLLVIMIMVVTGGQHGPGRHIPSGRTDRYTLPVALGGPYR